MRSNWRREYERDEGQLEEKRRTKWRGEQVQNTKEDQEQEEHLEEQEEEQVEEKVRKSTKV